MTNKFRERLRQRGYDEKEYNILLQHVHHYDRDKLLQVKRKPLLKGDPILSANKQLDDNKEVNIPLIIRYSSSWDRQPTSRQNRKHVKNIIEEAVRIFPLEFSQSPA